MARALWGGRRRRAPRAKLGSAVLSLRALRALPALSRSRVLLSVSCAMRLHFRSLDGDTWEADLWDEVVHETAARWASKKGPKAPDGDVIGVLALRWC